MPLLVQHQFDYLPARSEDRKPKNVKYWQSKSVQALNKKVVDDLQLAQLAIDTDQAEDPTIGSSVFLVCESQEVAAEKYTALVANDSSRPEALLAPNAQEVVWKNVGRSGKVRAINVLLFWVILIALFVAYLWGQTVLMGTLYKSETTLTETFLHILSSCKTVEVAETQCPFALSISQMLYTMIPTMTYCILMGLLPVMVDYAILLLGYPSVSKNKDLLYKIIFVFLILIMGII